MSLVVTPAAYLRAQAVLDRLPKGPVVGAEIGVWRGYMSVALLSRRDLTLYMVDNWEGLSEPGYTSEDQPCNMEFATSNTVYAAPRRHILQMDSVEAAKRLDDGSLDFVFIDADHSYKAVVDDIQAWMPKIKKGGWLSGHDYNNPRGPWGAEVKQAVDEAVEKNGWKLELDQQTTWFVRL